MADKPQIKPQKSNEPGSQWGWNLAVAFSFFFLAYLPAQETGGRGDYLTLLKLLPTGIGYTLGITLSGSVAAIAVGFLVGLGKLSRKQALRVCASFYTEILRGIPLLVLLFYIYYALGEIFHISALVSAVAGFGFCYGAYMSDVFRAGIESIPKEQEEAARSLGMTPNQALFQVILPQAMRTIIPAVGNQTLGMLKDTSLVSVLAISDVLRVGNEYATKHFNYFQTYTYIALTYLALTLLLSRGVMYMERRFNVENRRQF